VAKPLKARQLLATLEGHRVDYVVIGGLAAVLHGSPTVTGDADICPQRSNTNLARIADALREMHAKVRTAAEPDGLDFACDAAFLSRMKMVDLTTDFGDFDLAFEPAGFAGYEELVERAVTVPIGGANVKIASLADVIRSKETANRPTDQATLPILYALQDEIAKRERG
jgi:hypothetical protein